MVVGDSSCFSGLKADIVTNSDAYSVISDVKGYLGSAFTPDEISKAGGDLTSIVAKPEFQSTLATYKNYLDKQFPLSSDISKGQTQALFKMRTQLGVLQNLGKVTSDATLPQPEVHAMINKIQSNWNTKLFFPKDFPVPMEKLKEQSEPKLAQLMSGMPLGDLHGGAEHAADLADWGTGDDITGATATTSTGTQVPGYAAKMLQDGDSVYTGPAGAVAVTHADGTGELGSPLVGSTPISPNAVAALKSGDSGYESAGTFKAASSDDDDESGPGADVEASADTEVPKDMYGLKIKPSEAKGMLDKVSGKSSFNILQTVKDSPVETPNGNSWYGAFAKDKSDNAAEGTTLSEHFKSKLQEVADSGTPVAEYSSTADAGDIVHGLLPNDEATAPILKTPEELATVGFPWNGTLKHNDVAYVDSATGHHWIQHSDGTGHIISDDGKKWHSMDAGATAMAKDSGTAIPVAKGSATAGVKVGAAPSLGEIDLVHDVPQGLQAKVKAGDVLYKNPNGSSVLLHQDGSADKHAPADEDAHSKADVDQHFDNVTTDDPKNLWWNHGNYKAVGTLPEDADVGKITTLKDEVAETPAASGPVSVFTSSTKDHVGKQVPAFATAFIKNGDAVSTNDAGHVLLDHKDGTSEKITSEGVSSEIGPYDNVGIKSLGTFEGPDGGKWVAPPKTVVAPIETVPAPDYGLGEPVEESLPVVPSPPEILLEPETVSPAVAALLPHNDPAQIMTDMDLYDKNLMTNLELEDKYGHPAAQAIIQAVTFGTEPAEAVALVEKLGSQAVTVEKPVAATVHLSMQDGSYKAFTHEELKTASDAIKAMPKSQIKTALKGTSMEGVDHVAYKNWGGSTKEAFLAKLSHSMSKVAPNGVDEQINSDAVAAISHEIPEPVEVSQSLAETAAHQSAGVTLASLHLTEDQAKAASAAIHTSGTVGQALISIADQDVALSGHGAALVSFFNLEKAKVANAGVPGGQLVKNLIDSQLATKTTADVDLFGYKVPVEKAQQLLDSLTAAKSTGTGMANVAHHMGNVFGNDYVGKVDTAQVLAKMNELPGTPKGADAYIAKLTDAGLKPSTVEAKTAVAIEDGIPQKVLDEHADVGGTIWKAPVGAYKNQYVLIPANNGYPKLFASDGTSHIQSHSFGNVVQESGNWDKVDIAPTEVPKLPDIDPSTDLHPKLAAKAQPGDILYKSPTSSTSILAHPDGSSDHVSSIGSGTIIHNDVLADKAFFTAPQSQWKAVGVVPGKVSGFDVPVVSDPHDLTQMGYTTHEQLLPGDVFYANAVTDQKMVQHTDGTAHYVSWNGNYGVKYDKANAESFKELGSTTAVAKGPESSAIITPTLVHPDTGATGLGALAPHVAETLKPGDKVWILGSSTADAPTTGYSFIAHADGSSTGITSTGMKEDFNPALSVAHLNTMHSSDSYHFIGEVPKVEMTAGPVDAFDPKTLSNTTHVKPGDEVWQKNGITLFKHQDGTIVSQSGTASYDYAITNATKLGKVYEPSPTDVVYNHQSNPDLMVAKHPDGSMTFIDHSDSAESPVTITQDAHMTLPEESDLSNWVKQGGVDLEDTTLPAVHLIPSVQPDYDPAHLPDSLSSLAKPGDEVWMMPGQNQEDTVTYLNHADGTVNYSTPHSPAAHSVVSEAGFEDSHPDAIKVGQISATHGAATVEDKTAPEVALFLADLSSVEELEAALGVVPAQNLISDIDAYEKGTLTASDLTSLHGEAVSKTIVDGTATPAAHVVEPGVEYTSQSIEDLHASSIKAFFSDQLTFEDFEDQVGTDAQKIYSDAQKYEDGDLTAADLNEKYGAVVGKAIADANPASQIMPSSMMAAEEAAHVASDPVTVAIDHQNTIISSYVKGELSLKDFKASLASSSPSAHQSAIDAMADQIASDADAYEKGTKSAQDLQDAYGTSTAKAITDSLAAKEAATHVKSTPDHPYKLEDGTIAPKLVQQHIQPGDTVYKTSSNNTTGVTQYALLHASGDADKVYSTGEIGSISTYQVSNTTNWTKVSKYSPPPKITDTGETVPFFLHNYVKPGDEIFKGPTTSIIVHDDGSAMQVKDATKVNYEKIPIQTAVVSPAKAAALKAGTGPNAASWHSMGKWGEAQPTVLGKAHGGEGLTPTPIDHGPGKTSTGKDIPAFAQSYLKPGDSVYSKSMNNSIITLLHDDGTGEKLTQIGSEVTSDPLVPAVVSYIASGNSSTDILLGKSVGGMVDVAPAATAAGMVTDTGNDVPTLAHQYIQVGDHVYKDGVSGTVFLKHSNGTGLKVYAQGQAPKHIPASDGIWSDLDTDNKYVDLGKYSTAPAVAPVAPTIAGVAAKVAVLPDFDNDLLHDSLLKASKPGDIVWSGGPYTKYIQHQDGSIWGSAEGNEGDEDTLEKKPATSINSMIKLGQVNAPHVGDKVLADPNLANVKMVVHADKSATYIAPDGTATQLTQSQAKQFQLDTWKPATWGAPSLPEVAGGPAELADVDHALLVPVGTQPPVLAAWKATNEGAWYWNSDTKLPKGFNADVLNPGSSGYTTGPLNIDKYLQEIGIDPTDAPLKIKMTTIMAHAAGNKPAMEVLMQQFPSINHDAPKMPTVLIGGKNLTYDKLQSLKDMLPGGNNAAHKADPALAAAKEMGIKVKDVWGTGTAQNNFKNKIDPFLAVAKAQEVAVKPAVSLLQMMADPEGAMISAHLDSATLIKEFQSTAGDLPDTLTGQKSKFFAAPPLPGGGGYMNSKKIEDYNFKIMPAALQPKTDKGAHAVFVVADQYGQQWIYKPMDQFLADTEHGALQLQDRLGWHAPTSGVVKGSSIIDHAPGSNEVGVMQRMFQNKGSMEGVPPSELSEAQLRDATSSHVFDWLLDNDDTHYRNLMRLNNGRLAGIDKGRAFKHFGRNKLNLQSLDGNMMDHGKLGGDTYYTDVYKLMAKKLKGTPADKKMVDRLYNYTMHRAQQVTDSISDDEYRNRVSTLLAKRDNISNTAFTSKDKLIDAAVARKNSMQDDFKGIWKQVYDQAGETPPELSEFAPRLAGDELIGRTPDLWHEVSVHNVGGAATFFNHPDVEGGQELWWTTNRKIGSATTTEIRGEIKIGKTSSNKLEKWIQENGNVTVTASEHAVSSYTPLVAAVKLPGQVDMDKTISMYAKTVGAHAQDSLYNPEKVKAAEDLHTKMLSEKDQINFNPDKFMADHDLSAHDLTQYKLMVDKNIKDLQMLDDAKAFAMKPDYKVSPFEYTAKEADVVPEAAPVVSAVTGFTVTKESLWDPELFSKNNVTGVATYSGPYRSKLASQVSGGSGKWNASAKASGTNYHIDFGNGTHAEYIPWQSGSTTSGGLTALQGRLTFVADNWSGDDSQLKPYYDMLKAAGLELTPATEESAQLMYWRQLEGTVKGRSDSSRYKPAWDYLEKNKTANMKPADEIQVYRDAYKLVMNPQLVDEADWRPHFLHTDIQNPSENTGKGYWNRPDVTAADLVNMIGDQGLKVFGSDIMAANLDQVIMSGGLMSTVEKFRALGLPRMGMSPESDVNSGGANAIFTRLNGGATGVVFNPDALLRMSTYSFPADKYGNVAEKLNSSQWSLANVLKTFTGGGNETCVQDAMTTLDDIEVAAFNDEGKRQSVLDYFKQEGITEIRGVPVENRFVLGNVDKYDSDGNMTSMGANTAMAQAWDKWKQLHGVTDWTPINALPTPVPLTAK
jgi:hypothetical protein